MSENVSADSAELFQPVMAPSPLTNLLASSLAVFPGAIVVDVGCGSGVLAMTAVERGARLVYAVDTNPRALVETAELAKRFGCSRRVLPVLADLCNLSNIVTGGVDIILCNPPQLPSRISHDKATKPSAYDAGADGRHYIRALILEVRAICALNRARSPSLQLVTTSVADPESTLRELREAGFHTAVVAQTVSAFRPAYYEVLDLLKKESYFAEGGVMYERLFSIRAALR